MTVAATSPIVPLAETRSVLRAPTIERASWALFDFAQTIFSMNIATLFFAVWLISDLGASDLQFASAGAVASILVVLAIPVLGAFSDARRRRMPWIIGFALLCGLGCLAMGWIGNTRLPLVGTGVIGVPAGATISHPTTVLLLPLLAAYVLANFAYQATHPFYNAMLPDLVPVEERGRMSGVGIAVGYVGSIMGVLFVFPFFAGTVPFYGPLPASVMHALRTLVPFTSHGGRVSTIVPTGLLFLAFALPLLVFGRDHHPASPGTPVRWRKAFTDVAHTVRDARRHPGSLRFIVSSLIYQDAIGTIISFMTVYAVKAIGFGQGSEVMLFVVLTVPAIFGSYLAGRMVDRFGPKKTLQITLLNWIALLVAMIAVPTKTGFWVVGLLLGFNYGGVNAAERPMLLSLIPDREAGRYFGLMLLSARVAAVAGPLIWGETVGVLEPVAGTAVAYRAAVLTVAGMFTIGLLVLRGVPDTRTRDEDRGGEGRRGGEDERQRFGRRAALLLTALRGLLAPVVVVLAMFGAPGYVMAGVIVIAAVSDVYDGKIARHFGVASAGLRRLDSVVDTVFYLAVGVALWILHPDALRAHAVLLGVFLLMQVLGYLVDVAKFGRDTSYHTWTARVFGVTLLVATTSLCWSGRADPWLAIALVTGMVSHVDAFAITMILPEWRHDVRSVRAALAIRHALARAS